MTSTEAQEFVQQQPSGQVFQARLPSDGKVTATREDMRWHVDLLDFSKRASSQRGGANKYALVATDVFTKEAWVEPMMGKTDHAAKEAIRKVFAEGGTPKEISTDLGKEFSGHFETFLKDQGVISRKKKPATGE